METLFPVTHVKITAEAMCRIHGWTVGGVYPILDRGVNTPDSNGLEVWVESSAWKRPVWLSSAEYKPVASS